MRERTDEDLPGCVAALKTVHAARGYPAVWPADAVVAAFTRTPPDRLVAVSRLFAVPAARGRGTGAALLAAVTAQAGFSTEFWMQEVWRALEFESKEAFLAGFLEPYFLAMDPNDLLAMMWKWQRGDVARHTGGDLAAALGRITARVFVVPIDEDMSSRSATTSPSRR